MRTAVKSLINFVLIFSLRFLHASIDWIWFPILNGWHIQLWSSCLLYLLQINFSYFFRSFNFFLFLLFRFNLKLDILLFWIDFFFRRLDSLFLSKEVWLEYSLLFISFVEQVIYRSNLVVLIIVKAVLCVFCLESELLKHFYYLWFDWKNIFANYKALIFTHWLKLLKPRVLFYLVSCVSCIWVCVQNLLY